MIRRLWRRLCGELELPALHDTVEVRRDGRQPRRHRDRVRANSGARWPLFRSSRRHSRSRRCCAWVTTSSEDACCPACFPASGSDRSRPRVQAKDASASTVRADSLDGGAVLTGECTHRCCMAISPISLSCRRRPMTPSCCTSWRLTLLGSLWCPCRRSTAPARSPSLKFAQARADALTAGAPDDVDRVLDVARILLAAEMLGGAEIVPCARGRVCKQQTQFDRPIGSFQAVKHACADMMIEIDATRAMVMFAAMGAASDPDKLKITAPMAKAQSADTYVLVRRFGHPGSRRNRLHLGARPAPVLPPGPDERGIVRRQCTAPGAGRRSGRPVDPGGDDFHTDRLHRDDRVSVDGHHAQRRAHPARPGPARRRRVRGSAAAVHISGARRSRDAPGECVVHTRNSPWRSGCCARTQQPRTRGVLARSTAVGCHRGAGELPAGGRRNRVCVGGQLFGGGGCRSGVGTRRGAGAQGSAVRPNCPHHRWRPGRDHQRRR